MTTDLITPGRLTVYLFERVICDELVSEGVIGLRGFDDLRPRKMSQKLGFDGEKARA